MLCAVAARSLLSPSYYHSFGLSQQHVVFLEQPFKLDILRLATAYVRGVNWASCLTFHGEDKVWPDWDPAGRPLAPRSSALRQGGTIAGVPGEERRGCRRPSREALRVAQREDPGPLHEDGDCVGRGTQSSTRAHQPPRSLLSMGQSQAPQARMSGAGQGGAVVGQTC